MRRIANGVRNYVRAAALSNGGNGTTIAQQVAVILAKYGTDAHVYLPGIGIINGFTAGNYLDSAGVTPATVDNPVGLVLDGAGSVGAELAPNIGNPFTVTTGWGLSGAVSISLDNGRLAALVDSVDDSIQTAVTTVVGKTYKVTVNINRGTITAPQFGLRATGAIASQGVATTGDFEQVQYFVATATSQTIRIGTHGTTASYSGTFYINSCSVKEVTGIHATQGTTANKPILRRGAVNLLTYSEDFSNAAWSVAVAGTGITATKTPNYGIAPDGTTTACRVQLNKGAGNTASDQAFIINNIAAGAAAVNTEQFWAKSNDSNSYIVSIDGTNTIKTITPTWSLISGSASAAGFRAFLRGTFGTSNAADILIWHPQYETGSTASTYIPTTTAAASSASGNYKWEFDGTNDSLTLGSVPFQMSDDHLVMAGIFATRATANNVIFDIRDALANGIAGRLVITASGICQAYWRDDAGVIVVCTGTTNLVNTNAVVEALKIGNAKKLFVNGTQEDTTKTTAMGAATLSLAKIGADGTGSVFYQGSIYMLIDIKGTVLDAERSILRKFMALQSGAIVNG